MTLLDIAQVVFLVIVAGVGIGGIIWAIYFEK
jgi:hypothetical protein